MAIAPTEIPKCILCDKPSVAIGCFIPDLPAKWGAVAGMRRGIFYAVCGSHDMSSRMVLVMVEQEIERRMKAGASR